MLNEHMPLGQRVRHATTGVVGKIIDLSITSVGRHLAVVLLDGEAEPRTLLTAVLVAEARSAS